MDLPIGTQSSCLSKDLYHLIYEIWEEQMMKKESWSRDYVSCLRKDGSLNWTTVKETLLKDIDLSLFEGNYKLYVVRLLPVCHLADLCISQLSEQQFIVQYGDQLKWTGQAQIFIECFKLIQSENNVDNILSILLCTAALERALGDMYLLKETPCPFLLKDLLSTSQLQEIFGPIAIFCLHVMIGPPTSLNIRNVLWHGFAAPNEIPKLYASFLLVLTASLSQFLPDEETIIHRSPLQLHHFTDSVFPEIVRSDEKDIHHVITTSRFILPTMQQYWFTALQYYYSGKYGYCCVLLLPQLENGLRRMFCDFNNCPQRMLTAESSVLYTTFDDMLNPTLPNGEENALVSHLGDSLMELLLDMLMYMEGPRVRDHISHGELDVLSLPQYVATHVVSVSIVFALKCSTESCITGRPLLQRLHSVGKVYESSYHPVAYCKRSLQTLCLELRDWDQLPEPCLDVPPSSSSSESVSVHSDLKQRILSGFDSSQQSKDIVRLCSSLSTLDCVQHLNQAVHVRTLFMQRNELEVVGLLRKISSHGIETAKQIKLIAATRFQQWQTKELRSRQRNNYIKFLNCLPVLSSGLQLMLFVITTQLSLINSTGRLEIQNYRRLIKYLKGVLQYAENLTVFTSLGTNKWDESSLLTDSFITHTEEFYSYS